MIFPRSLISGKLGNAALVLVLCFASLIQVIQTSLIVASSSTTTPGQFRFPGIPGRRGAASGARIAALPALAHISLHIALLTA